MTKESHIALVFDRFVVFSTKESTWKDRENSSHGYRYYKLSLNTPLPSKEVILGIGRNKAQLIRIFEEELVKHFCENCTTNRLIISGLDVTPVEVTNGIRYSQDKYSTSHEEADVTMVIHFLVNEGKQIFQVLCDDTNLFALLLHYFQGLISRCQVFMVPLNEPPKIISIEGTFLKHKLLVPNLLAAHALSGCDTVGKTTVLNTLQKESITLKDAGGSDVKLSRGHWLNALAL